MKIRTKLFLGFFIITISSIVIGSIVFVNTISVDEHFTFLIEHDLEVLQNAQKLQKLVVDAETGQRGFIITGDESFLEPYTQGIQDFNSLIEIVKRLVSDNPSQVQRLETIQTLFDEWNLKAAQPEIAAARQFHETDTDFGIIETMLSKGVGKNILDEIRNEFTIFIQIENDLKTDRLSNVLTTSSFTIILLILLPIIITIITGSITVYFTKSISKPLEMLKEASTKISSGNLDIEIKQFSSDDEIGELSKSFNKMIIDIKKSRIQIENQVKELKKVDEQKEEFSAMISHELKTPLVPIQGYSEMLKDPEFGELNADQKEAVNEIYQNTVQLERLIENLLNAQRLEAQDVRYNYEKISVNKFLEDVLKTLSPFTESKNIEFKINSTAEFTIKADKAKLTEIITNLVRNSIDFVPDAGGRITIRTKDKKSFVEFSIEDNGSGMKKDKQENLFTKFYQVDNTDTRKHGGTGLGLTICKGYVEGMNGKIWVESEEGKGTTFFFTIPKV
jgi:signal transduction histidine kinase